MKKFLMILMAVVMSVCSFTACGKSDDDSTAISTEEGRKMLNSNNTAAEKMYQALNNRIASLYAEGKNIPLEGEYNFIINPACADYQFQYDPNQGVAVSNMTADETTAFLCYTVSNYKQFVAVSNDAPNVQKGQAVIRIDSGSNVTAVYYTNDPGLEYTGAYPIAPTSAPSYSINELPS